MDLENYKTREVPGAGRGRARRVVVNDSLVIQDRGSKHFMSIDWTKPVERHPVDNGSQIARLQQEQQARLQDSAASQKFKIGHLGGKAATSRATRQDQSVGGAGSPEPQSAAQPARQPLQSTGLLGRDMGAAHRRAGGDLAPEDEMKGNTGMRTGKEVGQRGNQDGRGRNSQGGDVGSASSRPGAHSTFSFEAREADEDLSMNVDLNQINKAAALDKKYELRGSMGSFKGHEGPRGPSNAPPGSRGPQGGIERTDDGLGQPGHFRAATLPPEAQSRERGRGMPPHPDHPKTSALSQIGEEQFLMADCQDPMLSSKGPDTTDGDLELFTSIANRQAVKNQSTIFEKRTNMDSQQKVTRQNSRMGKEQGIGHLALASVQTELRTSQTATFIQGHNDIKMNKAKKDRIRQQLAGNTRSGLRPAPLQPDFEKDYKIRVLDEASGEVELKLAHRSFEYMPRDILQLIGKQKKREGDDTAEDGGPELANRTLVTLDIEYNKIQELEGALFLHLGLNGPIELRQIRASHNQIKYISSRIKDCSSLQTLRLSHNLLNGKDFLPVELLNSHSIQRSLQYLYLAHNSIREVPNQLGKLKNLRVLDLVGNKLRQLQYKSANKQGKQQFVCPLQGLDALEELYLNENRLKDLPCVFHKFPKLKIIGLDWFTYLAHPLSLPKVLENPNDINLLKQNSDFQLLEKKNHYMTFKQFAQGFATDKKYDINSQNEDLEMRTSLHQAVLNKDRAMVNNLLKEGADPNLADFFSNTPLADALEYENFEIAKLILKFADRIDFKVEENQKLLLLAVTKLNCEIVESLLSNGCDPNSQRDTRSGKNCLHFLMDQFQKAFETHELDEQPTQLEINQSHLPNLRALQRLHQHKVTLSNHGSPRLDQSRSVLNEQLDETVLLDHQSKVDPDLQNVDGPKNAFSDMFPSTNPHMTALGSSRSNRRQDAALAPTSNRDRQSSRLQQQNESFEQEQEAETKEMNDVQKCKRILDLLITHGMDLNLPCNQKYTPFLYAVKLGNIRLISFLLERYTNGGTTTINVNATGSSWKNTAFHIAGMRSKYEIMYILKQYRADIFVRSRDGKTCFQYVNNNLLMLKIVKKLERRQYLQDHLDFTSIIMPPESQIMCSYSVKLNTGDYKAIDCIIQRIKREFFKPVTAAKRPSIFAKKAVQSGRASRQNSQARARENSVSGHIRCTDKSNEAKYQRVSYVDFLMEEELVMRRPRNPFAKLNETTASMINTGRDSPRSCSVNFNLAVHTEQMSDVNSTSKIRLSNAKIQNLNVSNWQESLKMYAGPKLNLDQQAIKSRRNKKLKAQQEAAKDGQPVPPLESCDVLDTSRPVQSSRPQPDKPLSKTEQKARPPAAEHAGSRFDERLPFQRAQASRKEWSNQALKATHYEDYTQNPVDHPKKKSPWQAEHSAARAKRQQTTADLSRTNSIVPASALGESSVAATPVHAPRNSQNHKNIFFIKDQIFDKERMKQIQYNQQVVKGMVHPESSGTKATAQGAAEAEKRDAKAPGTDGDKKAEKELTAFSLPSQYLEFQQGGIAFTYAHRHSQEVKLISQLRSTFNPRLKTHVTVMCEILERIHRLKDSRFMIGEILDIVSMHLQCLKMGQNAQGVNESFDSLYQALQSLSENVNCPQFIQEQLQDLLLLNYERKPLKLDNTEANIKDSLDGSDQKDPRRSHSESNLEHDLGGVGDIDDMPSAKIARYVQSQSQSEASQRIEHAKIEIKQQQDQHNSYSNPHSYRKGSVKRIHSVDLQNMAKARDFPRSFMGHGEDDPHLKIEEGAASGSGRASIAHINKNPLTNSGRHDPFEARGRAPPSREGRPYQDPGAGRLDSSGQRSISLTACQIKIGSRHLDMTPGQHMQSGPATEDKSYGRANGMKAIISKFSDEFGQAANLLVSSESPERVDLKIKNLHALSKRDYRQAPRGNRRTDTGASAATPPPAAASRTRPGLAKKLDAYSRRQERKLDVTKEGSEGFGQGSAGKDRGHGTKEQKQAREGYGKGPEGRFVPRDDASEQFSPTSGQPPASEKQPSQSQFIKKKLILKKTDIKFRQQQQLLSAWKNEEQLSPSPRRFGDFDGFRGPQTPSNDDPFGRTSQYQGTPQPPGRGDGYPDENVRNSGLSGPADPLDSIDALALESSSIQGTLRAANKPSRSAAGFRDANAPSGQRPLDSRTGKEPFRIRPNEHQIQTHSGGKAMRSQRIANDARQAQVGSQDWAARELELKMHGTFDGGPLSGYAKSLLSKRAPTKDVQSERSDRQLGSPSHHIQNQKPTRHEPGRQGRGDPSRPGREAERDVNQPRGTHMERVITPQRKANHSQKFQQIKATASITKLKNFQPSKVNEVDLSKQKPLPDRLASNKRNQADDGYQRAKRQNQRN